MHSIVSILIPYHNLYFPVVFNMSSDSILYSNTPEKIFSAWFILILSRFYERHSHLIFSLFILKKNPWKSYGKVFFFPFFSNFQTTLIFSLFEIIRDYMNFQFFLEEYMYLWIYNEKSFLKSLEITILAIKII